MNSPLPQRFPWNLWQVLQSNPLLPSQALEAHQTQFSFQAHPGSPSLSISMSALVLHPKTRSPKAAKHKKCLDTLNTAESNSSHVRQLIFRDKDIDLFLPSHCLLVAGLPRRWETLAWSPPHSEEAQKHHLVHFPHPQGTRWQGNIKDIQSSWMGMMKQLPANTEGKLLKGGKGTARPGEGEPWGPSDSVQAIEIGQGCLAFRADPIIICKSPSFF